MRRVDVELRGVARGKAPWRSAVARREAIEGTLSAGARCPGGRLPLQARRSNKRELITVLQ